MAQSSDERAGHFRQGRLVNGRPEALDTWRVTTDSAEVASRVASLLGSRPQPDGVSRKQEYDVVTNRDSVRVIMDRPDAVVARMILQGHKGLVHECNSLEFFSPEKKKGQPCGCPPRLEDQKLAAKAGRGPSPSIDLTFRIAADPTLGEFQFLASSWHMAAQVTDLTAALERVGGPAVCDLSMELVTLTTRAGTDVCYRSQWSPFLVTPTPFRRKPCPRWLPPQLVPRPPHLVEGSQNEPQEPPPRPSLSRPARLMWTRFCSVAPPSYWAPATRRRPLLPLCGTSWQSGSRQRSSPGCASTSSTSQPSRRRRSRSRIPHSPNCSVPRTVVAAGGGRLVSVPVSFTPVRPRPRAVTPEAPPQLRTPPTPAGPPYEHLESVLGATPHEFESRILRPASPG
jgi:hypothetical protein